MYDVLVENVPRVFTYSIDEMFLDFAGLTTDREARAAAIRDNVRRIAKTPTCDGIGPTKSIVKRANKVAKQDRKGSGVCDLSDADTRLKAYRDIDLSDVWGLGRAWRVRRCNL